jgi:hypothetical protein
MATCPIVTNNVSLQYDELAHKLFHGSRLLPHIVLSDKRLLLQAIFCGNILNHHANGFVVVDYCRAMSFVAISPIATDNVSWQYIELPRKLFRDTKSCCNVQLFKSLLAIISLAMKNNSE